MSIINPVAVGCVVAMSNQARNMDQEPKKRDLNATVHLC